MKIIEIIRKPINNELPNIFTVGAAPAPGFDVVEEIKYNKHAYNKGFQGDFPSYTISFVDSKVRRIVPASEILELGIDIAKAEEEAAPALPEAAEGENNEG